MRAQARHAEDGATVVMVAILMLVLFGFAALAIDVGASFWERRQLQNGADAGSLAVAQDVARHVATGGTVAAGDLNDHHATAKGYADANAADGAADLDAPPSLTPIAGVDLTRGGEVTVTTLVNDGGQNELSHYFAPVIGIPSSRITATASAIYGPLGAIAGAFPVVICEYEYDNDGNVFEVVLKRPPGQGGEVQTDCPTEPETFPTGQTPGNFSWLNPTGDGCTVDFDLDDPDMQGDTGVNVPTSCGDEAKAIADGINAYKAGTASELPVRYVAVFSKVDGTGATTYYTITKLAAFEFHGIKTVIPGHGATNAVVDSWSTGPDSCNGDSLSTHCVKGRFTGGVATGPIDYDADSDVLGVQLSR